MCKKSSILRVYSFQLDGRWFYGLLLNEQQALWCPLLSRKVFCLAFRSENLATWMLGFKWKAVVCNHPPSVQSKKSLKLFQERTVIIHNLFKSSDPGKDSVMLAVY